MWLPTLQKVSSLSSHSRENSLRAEEMRLELIALNRININLLAGDFCISLNAVRLQSQKCKSSFGSANPAGCAHVERG